MKGELDRLAEGLPLGVLNSLGNHELYNFSKRRWAREVGECERLSLSNFTPPKMLNPI